jgi:NAD(P)-dependent dehydrogenase (short-subunit alcohol dehydrogenase family)
MKNYEQSKLANVLFTKELARRLESTQVTVNSLHPGVVDTELFKHFEVLSVNITSLLFKPILFMFFKTPKNGAQTSVYAALDPDLDNVTGKYFV